MSIYKRATVLAAAASLVAVWGLAEAAQLTQAHVEACNREAQAWSSPATSPRTTPDMPSSTPIPGTQGPTGTPGMGASNESGTKGAVVTPPAGSSATGIGPGGPVPGSAGMPPAAVGQGNPAYEQAFRECLRRHGF